MPTYRPLTDEEESHFRSYTQYAFNPESDGEADLPEGPMTLGDRRGLFIEGGADRPVSVCAHHWFEADVRGRRLETPGLSAVATPPEHRREGHVRSMLAAALEEYRDRDEHLSILWPFKHAFYRNLGWGEAHRVVEYELEPSAARSLADGRRGSFHEVDPNEFDRLDAVYRATVADLDLAVDRSPEWWRHRVFESFRGEPYVYAWAGPEGEVRGYVAFHITREGSTLTLKVADRGAADPDAYRQVWGFLGDHDSQVSTIAAYDRAEAPLLDYLGTRDGVEVTMHGGLMARVVDAAHTLGSLAYPEGNSASVVFDVGDDLVDWHDERLHVRVDDGSAEVAETDAAADVTLDIAALSALAVGARPPRAMAGAGHLEATPDVVETLEALFPPRTIHCRDSF